MMKSIRKDYVKEMLTEDAISEDPKVQFDEWLHLAFNSGNDHANAMTLSTVDKECRPSSRVVLLRDVSHGGFTFYTNYKSKKAMEIKANPNASMLFFWPELERQIRIEGEIKFLHDKEADDYFESRPFESKVGAWVSAQSTVIKGRAEMDEAFANELKKYEGKKVPRPEHWGGFVLIPTYFEFWQGRANRLHDRIQYRLNSAGGWIIERLMP